MKFIKEYKRNRGTGKHISKEEIKKEIKFTVYKNNNKIKPSDKSKILFITCFSEFGCESIALLYGIPKVISEYAGYYIICVGWYGREYLYRHLADEYWEIEEGMQWLREYSSSFDHCSKNLLSLEKSLSKEGNVYRGVTLGNYFVGNKCLQCDNFWASSSKSCCPKCHSNLVKRSIFSDVIGSKKDMVKIPSPSLETVNYVKKYLKPNSVGIFARNRMVWGRNFDADFYRKMISLLENKGYNPIWLGEKQSVLPCPCDHIVDFTSTPEARDLEKTLAIISQLKFTIQLWTASTRFASMVDTPWILYESPDQIFGCGQEGKRIALTSDRNKRKLILSQYHNVLADQDKALKLLGTTIDEIENDNWNDVIGQVEQPMNTKRLLSGLDYWK